MSIPVMGLEFGAEELLCKKRKKKRKGQERRGEVRRGEGRPVHNRRGQVRVEKEGKRRSVQNRKSI